MHCRARLGTDVVHNAVHCSQSEEAAAEELTFFFERPRNTPNTYDNCSCLLIKPHAVKDKNVGAVLHAVQEAGLEINGLRAMAFNKKDAADFYEPYKYVPLGMIQSVSYLFSSCVHITHPFKKAYPLIMLCRAEASSRNRRNG